LDNITTDRPQTGLFIERLASQGVDVRFYTNSKGVYGMSLLIDGISFKASSLGKKYTWKNFKNTIDYDYKRDHATIVEKGNKRARACFKGTGGKPARSKYGKYRGFARGISPDVRLSEANGFIHGRRSQELHPIARSNDKDYRKGKIGNRPTRADSAENNRHQEQHRHKNDDYLYNNRSHNGRYHMPRVHDVFWSSLEDTGNTEKDDNEKKKKKKNRNNGLSL
jgi:hypothetical protein